MKVSLSVVVFAVVLIATGLVPAGTSNASTFPGTNGLLAFSSGDGGSGSTYIATADGSQSGVIVNGTFPSWSPDGTKIVYATTGGLYIMKAAFGAPKFRLTTDQDQWPSWSPDGSRIAFMRLTHDKFGNQVTQIWVINADRSDAHPITPKGGFEYYPTWSPNGKRILYMGNNGGLLTTWPDGTHTQSVLPDYDASGPGYYPKWSPDGEHILYGIFDIYEIPSGGGTPVLLVSGLSSGGQAAFSPNGTDLAYSSGDTVYVAPLSDVSSATPVASAFGAIQRVEWGSTCTIVGDNKDNTLVGTSGPDVICGNGGNDTIAGLGGNDVIFGGNGNDTIRGGSGNDILSGDDGRDRVFGGDGGDLMNTRDHLNESGIDGGGGADSCVSDAGDTVASCRRI